MCGLIVGTNWFILSGQTLKKFLWPRERQADEEEKVLLMYELRAESRPSSKAGGRRVCSLRRPQNGGKITPKITSAADMFCQFRTGRSGKSAATVGPSCIIP